MDRRNLLKQITIGAGAGAGTAAAAAAAWPLDSLMFGAEADGVK